HSSEQPAPLEKLRGGIPPGVVAIVMKLLAKRPADRFQTPAELVEALAPYAVSSPAAWSGVHALPPVVDPVATPPGDSGSDPLLPATDDFTALQPTVVPDQSPTPVSGMFGPLSAPRLAGSQRQPHWRWQLALAFAVGVVGGLVSVAVLLSLL